MRQRARQEIRSKMADKIEAKKENNMKNKPVANNNDKKNDKPAVAPATSTPVAESKPVDQKVEVKKDAKKEKVPQKPKKEEAIAKGTNLSASKKHCMYLCEYIKNKPIDQAIKEMQEVVELKRVIPMRGEVPHRSAPGIMSGRYPTSAAKQFIYLLKALKGNTIANGLDLDKTRIYFGSATWASRPSRRGGTRFKRAFVLLKAKEFNKGNNKMEAKK